MDPGSYVVWLGRRWSQVPRRPSRVGWPDGRRRDTKGNNRPRRRPPASPAAPGPEDQLAELQKLAQMQEQGLLTPEEFAAMKAKIIGS